jgi:hypothetical protein
MCHRRWCRPRERQAVIERIVAASAKVMIEHGGKRLGSGSGIVVASRALVPGETFAVPITRISRFLGEAGIAREMGSRGRVEDRTH